MKDNIRTENVRIIKRSHNGATNAERPEQRSKPGHYRMRRTSRGRQRWSRRSEKEKEKETAKEKKEQTVKNREPLTEVRERKTENQTFLRLEPTKRRNSGAYAPL